MLVFVFVLKIRCVCICICLRIRSVCFVFLLILRCINMSICHINLSVPSSYGLMEAIFNPQVDGQGKTDSLEPGDW